MTKVLTHLDAELAIDKLCGELVATLKSKFSSDEYSYAVNEIEAAAYQKQRLMRAFYSQPFTSELIIQLFEGWEKQHDNQFGYRFRHKPDQWGDRNSITSSYERRMRLYRGTDSFNWDVEQPVTLSDYISDCKRAGLELTWNPQVLKDNLFLKID